MYLIILVSLIFPLNESQYVNDLKNYYRKFIFKNNSLKTLNSGTLVKNYILLFKVKFLTLLVDIVHLL